MEGIEPEVTPPPSPATSPVTAAERTWSTRFTRSGLPITSRGHRADGRRRHADAALRDLRPFPLLARSRPSAEAPLCGGLTLAYAAGAGLGALLRAALSAGAHSIAISAFSVRQCFLDACSARTLGSSSATFGESRAISCH